MLCRHESITLLLNFIGIIALYRISIIEATKIFAFTNLKCTSYNTKLAQVEACRFRPINRNLTELSIRVNISQPIERLKVSWQLKKKSNGYQQYLPETHVNVCTFFAGRQDYLTGFLYKFVAPYTNVNHTCPLNHDLILERFQLNQSLLTNLIVPNGDYGIYSTWHLNGKQSGTFTVNVFFNLNVDNNN